MNARSLVPALAATAACVAALAAAVGLYYALRLAGVGTTQRQTVELESLLSPSIDVVTPEGAGPFPAVLMFHGCGGRRPMHDRYAEIAVEAGAAAIIVDSFAPRGIDRAEALTLVCSGALLMGRERAGDVAVAIDWARRRPDVDPDRLVLVGWSHGGWSILDLMAMDLEGGEAPQGLEHPPRNTLAGVRAAFLFYPYCRYPALARERWLVAEPAIEAVFGSADTVIGLRDCVSIMERETSGGRDVRWEVWPGLTHAFDDPEQPSISPHQYDAEGAARAEAAFADFLRRRLFDESGEPSEPAAR